MFRYLAFVWDAHRPGSTEAVRDWECRLQADESWKLVLSADGVRVWTAGATSHFRAHQLAQGAGVILGEIFVRQRDMQSDHAADRAVFAEHASREILATQGRRLISRYWGNYVALLLDTEARTTWVVKDPAGSLPCYVAACGGVQMLFSHLADCLQLRAVQFHVNWTFVRNRIANGLFDVETNPWAEVSSIRRGESLKIDARGECVARQAFWHPRNFEGADEPIDDPKLAAQTLRATVRSCVHSLAGSHERVLQQTSGGLDSSIVLSALGDAPHRPRVTCYTGFREGGTCDERRWARLAAAAGGHTHLELPFDTAKLDFSTQPSLAPSVYPICAMATWHRGPRERNLSAETGATAVFTGEGGDSAFCATSYVFAVDHALKRYGFSRRTLSIAVLVAARRDRTVWRVLRDTAQRRRGSRTGEYLRLMSDMQQLLHANTKQVGTRFPNPWFSADETIDLESIWRLGTLAFAPEFYDLSVSPSDDAPTTVSPLNAQPVYEVCRRIPVDLHFEGGRTRGLVRRAFAGRVPEPILKRQWKDRPLSQPADVVQRNLPFIREMLLDGHLAQAQMLDRTALETALSAELNRHTALAGEILSHLDLELWLINSMGRCA